MILDPALRATHERTCVSGGQQEDEQDDAPSVEAEESDFSDLDEFLSTSGSERKMTKRKMRQLQKHMASSSVDQ